ncbi:acyl carrier protein [Limnospira fusiformis KN01]|uniref:acyl carrier protein n=1 Tax=Limnospira TaxID=2596745 RepID=UPI001658852D|nr:MULTISPECIES: acyl carrier protein [Limnospira]MDT9200339.1 acyl carrier protein [Limnospira sp. PMC 1042.18]ULB45960.1 acyl carrier protein [Limnospira fusiformis KN01]
MKVEILVNQIAEILECDPSQLSEDTRFRDHANWDSLRLLSTIAMIDDNYQLVIPYSEFEKLLTVADLMRYIEENRG